MYRSGVHVEDGKLKTAVQNRVYKRLLIGTFRDGQAVPQVGHTLHKAGLNKAIKSLQRYFRQHPVRPLPVPAFPAFSRTRTGQTGRLHALLTGSGNQATHWP